MNKVKVIKMRTVLIVEDEPSAAEALTIKLKDQGFKTLWAKDGISALNMANKHRPDIILLDIIMPKMDGLSVLKEIRKDKEWGAAVPVIFLTNLSVDTEPMKQDVAKVFPADYLVKSNWRLSDVVKRINAILN